MKELRRIFRRCIAATLCCAMLLQSTCVYAAGDENSVSHTADTSAPSVKTYENNGTEVEVSDDSTDSSTNKNDNAADNGAAGGADNSTSDSTPADFSAVYADGRIRVCNSAQLAAIGTGAAVTSTDSEDGQLGKGTPVTDADGTQITYSPDAQYQLMNDIPLTAGSIWNLPAGFTGSFTSSDGSAVTKDAPLYDSATDTIYVYNSYQLDLICSENAAEEPVMSNDMIAEEFGMGQLVYPDGTPADGDAAAQSYLTYGPDHNYVLAMEFTAERPELKAEAVVQAEGDAEGRDFKGQVIYTDNNETEYILIGNRYQLSLIGNADRPVMTAAYLAESHGLWLEVCTDKNTGQPIMLYPGDADWQPGNGEFNTKPDAEEPAGTDSGNLFVKRVCGVDQLTGNPDPDSYMEYTGHTLIEQSQTHYYSSSENYIIFRNINLENEDWTPMMFSGQMEGRLNMQDGAAVEISNINIQQSGELNISTQMGVGFFGTISNNISEDDVGLSAGEVNVSDIHLKNVTVDNQLSGVHQDVSIIEGLLTLVGFVVDVVLAPLLLLLGLDSVTDLLTNLLSIRAKDPSIFATGSFAGRVIGDVRLTNCTADQVTVTSSNDMTGGFVGVAEGSTEYDGLSDALGDLVNGLADLLNIIPILGLGDLITLLLGNNNILPIGELIPTGYYNPVLAGCQVTNIKNNVIGTAGTSFNGGFAGRLTGARVENCSVSQSGLKNQTLTVLAKEYAGGFTGLARNGQIEGTLDLNKLGLNLINAVQVQTKMLGCQVQASATVTANNNYAGGFAGAMANSYAVDDGVTDLISVKAENEDYAGGFTGLATYGWGTELGKTEEGETDHTLIGTVGGLLGQVLSEDENAAILSLAGVMPSVIAGADIKSTDGMTIQAKNYAGGLVGKGSGVKIVTATNDEVSAASHKEIWKNDSYQMSGRNTQLSGVKEVSVTEDYAGGILGYGSTAQGGSVLGGTVGIVSYESFLIKNVTVTGADSQFLVKAGRFAGGAVGQGVGGDLTGVKIQKLSAVQAGNYAGGFIAMAAAGGLADTGGGLDVLGLGLIKIDNLLSLAEYLDVTITDCHVSDIVINSEEAHTGYTVKTTGSEGTVTQYIAGGFAGDGTGLTVTDSDATGLKEVSSDLKNGYAGGFVGRSTVGGLADFAGQDNEIAGIVDINGLISAVGYLIPEYKNCYVDYVSNGKNPQVVSDCAGGFAGEMQSGTVDNQSRGEGNYYAVYHIESVKGTNYAGGFAGRAVSGALAQTGGLSLLRGLGVNLSNLLGVIQAYIPSVNYAGVKSDTGFTVETIGYEKEDSASGSAGGYIGYGSGVQVSHCDVDALKSTKVTPPADLQSVEAPGYFNESSSYAVKAPRYAGGFIGNMNIGSAAAVGSGLTTDLVDLSLTGVLDALNVVTSTIEHSNVTGTAGGYSVLANGTDDQGALGYAGGFAGILKGGHIQHSSSDNINYIIGQQAAGGYVGEMTPGSVASVLEEADTGEGGDVDDGPLQNLLNTLLSKLADVGALADLVNVFIPTIRNSHTSFVPCGGAVRAHSRDGNNVERGMAGGYVGHNVGGQIWGNNSSRWLTKETYSGPQEPCAVIRLRSVYGYEYAGGFTGRMEGASTASLGDGVSLLGGLIKVDNLAGVLDAIYATDENTAIHGPLYGLDVATWNAWAEYVASDKSYGQWVSPIDLPEGATEEQINAANEQLAKYLAEFQYGYQVTAGRSSAFEADANTEAAGGDAGGYVGQMTGCTITNADANDLMSVEALNNVGGFAGEMISGGLTELGGVEIFGLVSIALEDLLSALSIFVPKIETSTVNGYQSGAQIMATGQDKMNNSLSEARSGQVAEQGNAGGFAGRVVGGQIWGSADVKSEANLIENVQGVNSAGGFAGVIEPGSVADVNLNSSGGVIGSLLNGILNTPASLVKALEATISNIHDVSVNGSGQPANGLKIGSPYVNGAPDYAGGFAGTMTGTLVGITTDADKENQPQEAANVTVNALRSVKGGYYAGGFVGLADVGSAVKVGESTPAGESSILELIGLGKVSALDIFRPYIYHAAISGRADGYSVTAEKTGVQGTLDSTVYSGCAGGFAGAILNGEAHDSHAENLSGVSGPNYTGGFVGHLGKSGVVDADSASLAGGILDLTAGVLDTVGCLIEDSSVTGITAGYTVESTGEHMQSDTQRHQAIAGGFVGMADLGHIESCRADQLKQVSSKEVAGGFAGEGTMAYLVDVEANSVVLNAVLYIVNELVKGLYLDELEKIDLVGLKIPGLLEVDVLSDGDVLSVNLLGLKISVSLSKENEDGTDDVVNISIGDSHIELPCNKDGITGGTDNLRIQLIKGNRTVITGSSATGVAQGYDVYGGGADYRKDGTEANGYAGGFVGYNEEARVKNNEMYLADVIRGTADKVGEFFGYAKLDSVYPFNDIKDLIGVNNNYRIYRKNAEDYTTLQQKSGTPIEAEQVKPGGNDPSSGQANNTEYTYYRVGNYGFGEDAAAKDEHQYYKGAKMISSSGGGSRDLEVWISSAKAKLMDDTETTVNPPTEDADEPDMQDPCSELIFLTIQKVWKDLSGVLQTRPKYINVEITRKYCINPNAAEEERRYIEDENFSKIVEIAADGADGNVWEEIVSGLDAYYLEIDEATGEVKARYPYVYEVKELQSEDVKGRDPAVEIDDKIDDYEIEVVEWDEHHYSVVITNQLTWVGLLPDAGGMGTRLLYLAGILLVMGAALSYIRSRSRMAEAAAGNGRPGNPGGRRRVRRRQRIHDRHSRR